MTKAEFCALLTNFYGEPIDKIEQQVSIIFTGEELFEFCEFVLINQWIKYDPLDSKTYPSGYGKYFVQRKDGKIHWETWNGTTWAYNGTAITHYQKIHSARP